jgi:NADH-quinone oxidoreductase subunit L
VLRVVWLVPALPLAGAGVNLLAGRRLGRLAGWLASAAVALAFAIGVGVLLDLVTYGSQNRVRVVRLFEWVSAGSFHVAASLRVDPLAMTMVLVVTGVGTLIHVYAIGYMSGDPRFGRFFGELNLFVFFMLMLVLADNYLVLYLGWEGVGLCSYLLIGFWSERPAAASAAKKAFVTTRIGDAAMLLGIIVIWTHVHSLEFGRVFSSTGISKDAATLISLLLLAGAVGKSAQFPLHVWLPDAMEGPTPVSALIHAATMVTAGVYLIVRSHVLFAASGVALTAVLVIGLVSALYAALASIGQWDIKRALAYSTMSQIGYMFFAAGMGYASGAMLLLVCHAFYKALLFLTSGNVMHGLAGETDLRRMGGLRDEMPISATWFVIGSLALAGLPPLGGFFAKDHILSFASTSGREVAWVLATIGAFFSALYITRALVLAFFGERRNPEHAHEAPTPMQVPLGLLALGAVVSGAGLGYSVESGRLDTFLRPVVGLTTPGTGGLSEPVLIVISVGVALIAIGLAYLIWGSGRIDWQAFPQRQPELAAWLANAFYVNQLFAWLVRVPGRAFARVVDTIDERVVDGLVNETGGSVTAASRVAPKIQTGLVRSYALAFLLGAACLMLVLVVRL